MIRNRTLDVSIITDAAMEPVTLEEVKTAIEVDFPDHDDFITGLITTARQMLEKHLNVTLAPKVLEAYFSHDSCFPYLLPYGPIGNITSVSYTYEEGEGVSITTGDYKVTGTDFKRFKGQKGYYTVRYAAGYTLAPQAIKNGIMKQVAWMYENRGDDAKGGQVNRDVVVMLSGYNKNAWI